MKRREFCRSALAAGVAASLPGYIRAGSRQLADLPAVTSRGAETTLEAAAINELADSLRGALLMKGDDGYDHARAVWNGMIDRKPALIARCEGAADVSNAIVFARERDLLVAVRAELEKLPDHRRAALEMKVLEGLTYREIAKASPARRSAKVG